MEISTTFRRKIEDIDEDAEFLTQPVSDDRTHELMRVRSETDGPTVADRELDSIVQY